MHDQHQTNRVCHVPCNHRTILQNTKLLTVAHGLGVAEALEQRVRVQDLVLDAGPDAARGGATHGGDELKNLLRGFGLARTGLAWRGKIVKIERVNLSVSNREYYWNDHYVPLALCTIVSQYLHREYAGNQHTVNNKCTQENETM